LKVYTPADVNVTVFDVLSLSSVIVEGGDGVKDVFISFVRGET
jgi:hypothetical protein